MAKKKNTKLHEWQNKCKTIGICAHCGIETPHLSVDHIVPTSVLDALDESGRAKYEDEDNFQLLCKICNTLKSSRMDKRNPKTKLIIMKYL